MIAARTAAGHVRLLRRCRAQKASMHGFRDRSPLIAARTAAGHARLLRRCRAQKASITTCIVPPQTIPSSSAVSVISTVTIS